MNTCTLTEEEISSLKWGIKFNLKYLYRILLVVSICVGIHIIVIYRLNKILVYEILTLISIFYLISILFWYYVFGKKYSNLKKDLKLNHKLIEPISVKKVLFDKTIKLPMVITNENIVLDYQDILQGNIDLDKLKVGDQLWVSYSPYAKIVFGVAGTKEILIKS